MNFFRHEGHVSFHLRLPAYPCSCWLRGLSGSMLVFKLLVLNCKLGDTDPLLEGLTSQVRVVQLKTVLVYVEHV